MKEDVTSLRRIPVLPCIPPGIDTAHVVIQMIRQCKRRATDAGGHARASIAPAQRARVASRSPRRAVNTSAVHVAAAELDRARIPPLLWPNTVRGQPDRTGTFSAAAHAMAPAKVGDTRAGDHYLGQFLQFKPLLWMRPVATIFSNIGALGAALGS